MDVGYRVSAIDQIYFHNNEIRFANNNRVIKRVEILKVLDFHDNNELIIVYERGHDLIKFNSEYSFDRFKSNLDEWLRLSFQDREQSDEV
jgi:hypothetical protein